MGTLLGSLLSASVVSALIAAFVSMRTNTRNIKVQHVTGERAKWRDEVRKKALEVHKAAVFNNSERLAELHLEFTLILNPFDHEDRQILSLIHRLPTLEPNKSALMEFSERLSLLLKHDWERAKLEAGPAFWKFWKKLHRRKSNSSLPYRTERISYERFKREIVGSEQPRELQK